MTVALLVRQVKALLRHMSAKWKNSGLMASQRKFKNSSFWGHAGGPHAWPLRIVEPHFEKQKNKKKPWIPKCFQMLWEIVPDDNN